MLTRWFTHTGVDRPRLPMCTGSARGWGEDTTFPERGELTLITMYPEYITRLVVKHGVLNSGSDWPHSYHVQLGTPHYIIAV